jgi:hypothetical protein
MEERAAAKSKDFEILCMKKREKEEAEKSAKRKEEEKAKKEKEERERCAYYCLLQVMCVCGVRKEYLPC